MSKIGKKNIVIPKESSIRIEGGNLTISGPKVTKKLFMTFKRGQNWLAISLVKNMIVILGRKFSMRMKKSLQNTSGNIVIV